MSTPNLFSDPGQAASATKSSPPAGAPTKADVQALLDQLQTEEQVLDECRRLGIKGQCMNPGKCLLAQLCMHHFPGCLPRVNKLCIAFFGHNLGALKTPTSWEVIIDRFDKNELPKEFYEF